MDANDASLQGRRDDATPTGGATRDRGRDDAGAAGIEGDAGPDPTVEVRAHGPVGTGTWNDLVRRSPRGSVLHRREALAAIADRTGATCHRLVGVLDGGPVGFFPVFEATRGPFSAAFSPPPGTGLPTLGPGVLPDAVPDGERPGVARSFCSACWDWLDAELGPGYVRAATAGPVAGLDALAGRGGVRVRPRFTYVLDLSPGREDLLASFSGDARRNLRRTDEGRYAVREGGRDAVRRVVDLVDARYAEQGLDFPVDAGFAVDLYDRLPDGWLRPYLLRVDGEDAGGLLVLDDGETVARWQGGGPTDVDLPVNDLLDWRVVGDAVDRGRARYDLVGANTARLCEYKAKFNPDLVAGHRVEMAGAGMRLVRALYRRFGDLGLGSG